MVFSLISEKITYNKDALLTSIWKGSIGVEILKALLSGGAQVVITTLCYSHWDSSLHVDQPINTHLSVGVHLIKSLTRIKNH